jgi:hypothetical protein
MKDLLTANDEAIALVARGQGKPVQTDMLIVPDAFHLALVECVADMLGRYVPILDWSVRAVYSVGAMAVLEALSTAAKTRLVTGRHIPITLDDSYS